MLVHLLGIVVPVYLGLLRLILALDSSYRDLGEIVAHLVRLDLRPLGDEPSLTWVDGRAILCEESALLSAP